MIYVCVYMCTCIRVCIYIYIAYKCTRICIYKICLLRVLDPPMVKERKVEQNTYGKQLLLNITERAFNVLGKCTYF